MRGKKLVFVMTKLKVTEKISCQRLGTAGLGELLKSPLAAHTMILFW